MIFIDAYRKEEKMKEKIIKYTMIIVPITVLIILSILYQKQETKEEIKVEPIIQEKEEIKEPSKIKIDIKGEIKKPGVYELEENTRVIDAINKSGGLTENADTNLINLSKTLTNEMVVIIYNKNEIEKIKNQNKEPITIIEYIEKECTCPDNINDACINDYKESPKEETDSKININKAPLEELMNIPGIGEEKAKKIIEYRTNTPFEKIEDITNISGIGEKTFEKFKEYITI